ncbi:MAG TPA: putative sulfate exporter family transporter [Gemmatimonadaceae bacterium]|nr:putative sulfate exporter family transporter [Gemmatimonadaceae bacterium]
MPQSSTDQYLTIARAGLFGLGALLSVSPLATPALALATGAILALVFGNPWPALTATLGSRLLQVAVVALGLGISLDSLVRAGTTGVGLTVLVIAAVFAVGIQLGRWMTVERDLSILVTAGTSICGGSAVAAIGPAIGASREAMSVALATVFVLNAVALYLFPVIGHLLDLSEHQFGVWAALAIHDTSSVVGAAASYGPLALEEATILKLARALWILPLVLIIPRWNTRASAVASSRMRAIPWFIGLFVLAAVARSMATPGAIAWFDTGARAGRTALVLTLFLIGASLTREQVRAVGMRPFLHGLILWIVVGSATLAGVVFVVSR